MASFIDRNEVVAQKRRSDLLVTSIADGTFAPPGTNFAGFVFVSQSSPNYVLATGTLTNKRRTLGAGLADVIEATDQVGNTVTMTAHTMKTGDGPWRPNVTSGGLNVAVDIWTINVGPNTIAYATSEANAYAGVKLDLTADVTGTQIISSAATKRGVPGHFTYEWTQAETDFDGSEGGVIVAEESGFYAYTSVTFKKLPKGFDDPSGEGARTYGDLARRDTRTLNAKFAKVGNDYQFRDSDDTKPSHHGTVTAAGRIAAVDDDLT